MWDDNGFASVVAKVATMTRCVEVFGRTYGHEFQVDAIARAYKHYLEADYAAEQVVFILAEEWEGGDKIPTPLELRRALSGPEKRRISVGEYVQAKADQKRLNDYTADTPEAYIIRDFNNQNDEKMRENRLRKENLEKLSYNGLKAIAKPVSDAA